MKIAPSTLWNWRNLSLAACAVVFAAMGTGAGICRGQAAGMAAAKGAPAKEDLKNNPALIEEFGQLMQRVLTEVKYPEGRKESRLLPMMPETTMSYAAFSNYGEPARQILKIFREELRESEPLRKWWGSGEMATNGPKVEALLERFSQFGEYVGNEMVVSSTFEGKEPKFLLLAEIRKPGLKTFLEKWAAELGDKDRPAASVVDGQVLSVLKNLPAGQDLILLVRPDYLVAGEDVEALKTFASRLDKKSHEFPSTPFGQRVSKAYEDGTTILAAADLQKILNTTIPAFEPSQASLKQSGFGDMKYAVWEHTGPAGAEVSKAELSFNGPRRGIASWLGKPRPLNSLDFVSPEAILAISLGLKDPARIYDEATEIAEATHAHTFAAVPEMERALQLNLRNDLLAELAGELTVEVDSLPPAKPVWRAILKINNATHLQKTLNTLLTATHIEVTHGEAEGATTYSFRAPNGIEISYAMVDGYLIVGPGRSAVMASVNMHRSGGSLAKSKKLLASLPPGRTAEASGMFYEDPATMAAMYYGRLLPGLAESLTRGTQSTQARTMWLYGDESAIREESASGPFDVGGILIVAAVAIPNLIRSKMAANEASAVGSLRTVVTAQITYSSSNPLRGFAPNLATLGPNPDGSNNETPQHAGLIDASLGGAGCAGNEWCVKSGYRFRMTGTCRQRMCRDFVAVATPVSDSTGTRTFCATSDGIIHYKVSEPILEPVSVADCKAWQALH